MCSYGYLMEIGVDEEKSDAISFGAAHCLT